MLAKIKDFCYHFNLYRTGEANNLRIILRILGDLQTHIYETERNEESNFAKTYNAYYEKMDNELEIFRAKIYGQKPEAVERCLVLSTMEKMVVDK